MKMHDGDAFVMPVKPQAEAEASVERSESEVTSCVRVQFRSATPIRIGGHEFSGVAAELTVEHAVGLCESLRRAIAKARVSGV